MVSTRNYTGYRKELTLEEIKHSIALWLGDLNFVTGEIQFFTRLLQAYHIKNMIPNLFENIQLFKKELSTFDTENKELSQLIKTYKSEIKEIPTTDEPGMLGILSTYEHLKEEVGNFFTRYKQLKIRLYEYLGGLIT